MSKASGGDGILTELFQILKDDAVKCCTPYASKFGKQQWPQDWKRSVFIPVSKKGNTAKVLHKICSADLEISELARELENVSFHSNPKERMPKNVDAIIQLHLFHMLARL